MDDLRLIKLNLNLPNCDIQFLSNINIMIILIIIILVLIVLNLYLLKKLLSWKN